MGLIEKLLRPTPFYNAYKSFIKRREEEHQAAVEKRLHPLRVAFYNQFLKNGDLVFDVGANVGNRVISFLECKARVIAVEPQPNCVTILKQKFGNEIIIENVGLSEKEGELEMHISTDSTVSSFSEEYIKSTKDRFKYSKWVDTIKVPITTLDALISKYGVPTFCKIDVEGFELQVLKGLHQPLPFLSLEYCVPEMHTQLQECISYLRTLDRTGQFNYSIGESMKWALPTWMNFDEFEAHINTESFIKSSFGDIYFKNASAGLN